jgi:hypothetical protein
MYWPEPPVTMPSQLSLKVVNVSLNLSELITDALITPPARWNVRRKSAFCELLPVGMNDWMQLSRAPTVRPSSVVSLPCALPAGQLAVAGRKNSGDPSSTWIVPDRIAEIAPKPIGDVTHKPPVPAAITANASVSLRIAHLLSNDKSPAEHPHPRSSPGEGAAQRREMRRPFGASDIGARDRVFSYPRSTATPPRGSSIARNLERRNDK